MSVYLDASVLVALFVQDAFSERAENYLRAHTPVLMVSDFAAAELASALARRVRMGELKTIEARTACSSFDAWAGRATTRLETGTSDIATAEAYLRRLDLKLRTPDAIHIAIAQRVAAQLATFDESMVKNARALKTKLASI